MWMSLLKRRFSFATFSPFLPIAFPMSPSLTTKIRRSWASTQSTTVVRVMSWKRATYLIVCSSNVTSAMRHLGAQDVRLPRGHDGEGRDGERHAARGAQLRVRPGEGELLHVTQTLQRIRRAVRGHDDHLRGLRLHGSPDFPEAEADVT